MAECFANNWLRLNGLVDQFIVVSRALTSDYEPPNSPASVQGINVLLKDYSLDMSSHRSALLTAEDVNDASHIIGVSKSHVQWILKQFPEASRKTKALPVDIPDPWHQREEVYRACAKVMQPLVYDVMAEVTSMRK